MNLDIDLNPRNKNTLQPAKQVFSSMENICMSDRVKKLYNYLVVHNQSEMTCRTRVADLEVAAFNVRLAMESIDRSLAGLPIPLPLKSKSLAALALRILEELSMGYMITLQQHHDSGSDLAKKGLTLSLFRAIRISSEIIFRQSKLYKLPPKGTWLNIHQLYAYAKKLKLHDKPIKRAIFLKQNPRVKDLYLQSVIYSKAKPSSLSGSEMKALYPLLLHLTKGVDLYRSELKSEKDISIDLNSDAPTMFNDKDDAEILFLGTSNLISNIERYIHEKTDSSNMADTLSLAILKKLCTNLTNSQERSDSRNESDTEVKVVIGFKKISENTHEAIEAFDTEEGMDDNVKPQPNLSLEPIPQADSTNDDYITHHGVVNESENPWDDIVKGRVVTDHYVEQRNKDLKKAQSIKKEDPDKYWKLVNIARKGYSLRWASDKKSNANVGDMVSLQGSSSSSNDKVYYGVIRWMRESIDQDFEIGVEIITSKISFTALEIDYEKHASLQKAILVPLDSEKNQKTTILISSSPGKSIGDTFRITGGAHEEDIRLESVVVKTGIFTQYEYSTISKQAYSASYVVKNEGLPSDDFGDAWAQL